MTDERDAAPFVNTYADSAYAAAYARLEFPGTYYLAFRDLPEILRAHAPRGRALDFGCGAGRSSRFLRRAGYEVVGVDISAEMLVQARRHDPGGDYRQAADGGLESLGPAAFDLVLSAFTFDNIPGAARKVEILRALRVLLRPGGTLVNLVSSPDIYVNEWASFSTRGFPENRAAASGDVVRIVNTAIADPRPCEDVLWRDADYAATYAAAGLDVVERYAPLGREGEPFDWVSETRVAPWVIWVLR